MSATENRFEHFFRMSLDMCCITGEGGCLEEVNPAFEALGYSRDELLARSVLEFVHPDDRAATSAEIERLRRGLPTVHFENRFRRKDGTYRRIAWTATPSASGMLFAIGRDVTESQQRSERQKHKYQAVFDTLPQMIWLKDVNNIILVANAAAAASIGRTPAEVEGRPTHEFYPEQAEKYHRDDLEVIRSGRAKLDIVERYDVEPGVVRWVRTDKTPYRDPEGKLVGVVVSATDVTEWKRAEDERALLYRQLKELDELKTRFFANVSHELRTPLTLILGPVETLLRSPDLPEAVRRELEVVGRNARALLGHVNDLLDVVRLDAGRFSAAYAEIDFDALVRAAGAQFESVAALRRVAFRVESSGVVAGQADPHLLLRVLTNVLGNAFKFTPPGGVVRCRVAAQATGDPRGAVIIEVADSGPGVEASMREAIFDRFRQVDGGSSDHRGGTGLGLSIARELVTLHGGQITAGAAPEGGALFTIRLPRLAPENAEVAASPPELVVEREAGELAVALAAAAPAPEADARPLVLVVEDNPDMNHFLVRALSTDYRVISAFDGQEGLERARALAPDLVVSDVMMPRLDGFALLRALRAGGFTSPMILLTARTDDASMLAGLAEGADDYITKPFSTRELQARVRAHLELAALRREASRREQEADRLRATVAARDEFLSIASHELRTPLATLQLSLQLLARLSPADAPQRTARLAAAVRSCRQLADLVDTLLDVGRAATGHLALEPIEFDMSTLVEEVAHGFEAQLAAAGCALELHVEGPAPGRWDRVRMEQAIANLLSNAVKFGAGKPIELACAADEEAVHITVRDHGIGIPPEEQGRIFRRFEQVAPVRHYGGLGLGLWITSEIVHCHAGTIHLESHPGEGAAFTLAVPRQAKGA